MAHRPRFLQKFEVFTVILAFTAHFQAFEFLPCLFMVLPNRVNRLTK